MSKQGFMHWLAKANFPILNIKHDTSLPLLQATSNFINGESMREIDLLSHPAKLEFYKLSFQCLIAK